MRFKSSTNGSNNTATGANALQSNTTGYGNTAMGANALQSNTIEGQNAAYGFAALQGNLGEGNTATGANALQSNEDDRLQYGPRFPALLPTTGASNIAVGRQAGYKVTTGSNNIDIGNVGAVESGAIRIGTGERRRPRLSPASAGRRRRAVCVYVNASGQLGTLNSSRRFKEEIADGKRERSDARAETGDIPLQTRP